MEENEFSTPTERRLAEIWAEVLQLDKVKRDQDFFEIGGDSLLATTVVVKACKVWDVKFTVRVLIAAPILHELAERIDESVAKSGRKPERETA
jgi:hypothetical protein